MCPSKRHPDPVEATSVRDAFDPDRPLPLAVLDTLAWLDAKDGDLHRYKHALRIVLEVASTGHPAAIAAARALYPEPRQCRSFPGCHNATPDGCCVDRGMEPM